jgi:hypothetical protein
MTTVYEDILASIGRISQSPVRDEIATLMTEWQKAFGEVATLADMVARLADLAVKVTGLAGAPDRKVELEIVKLAAETPVLGPAVLLAALPAIAGRYAADFWRLLYAEQQNKKEPGAPAPTPEMSGSMASWKILELPPPGPGKKYLIFSDVHRNPRSEGRKSILDPGTTDHFTPNATLYESLLDYAIKHPEYTIIEGGDCEELWFINSVKDYPTKPDGSLDVATKLQEIVDDHKPIYDMLRTLGDRYIRIQGNHDGYVRRNPEDDSVRRVIDNVMAGTHGEPNPPPYPIYDACIIPGVKTMAEHAAWELFKSAAQVAFGTITEEDFFERMVRAHVGLDASVYQERGKMIVAHGHQFDFWNCESNELLGLLISNTVVTFVDRHMDRLLDLRGIAWQGNPLVDFEDLLATKLITSGWPKESPAVAFAHRMQHMPNNQRLLVDGPIFSETIATIWSALGVALSGPDQVEPGQTPVPDPPQYTPAESRASLNFVDPFDTLKYVSRHHFHLVLLGHTHNPHSQPAFGLKNLAFVLVPPFSTLISLLQRLLPSVLQPALKTGYSNSGTVGWMEGVVWAIEIDEEGQSRLVYWTRKTKPETPERMDWELENLDPDKKRDLVEALRTVLDPAAEELEDNVSRLLQGVQRLLEQLNATAGALDAALTDTMLLPIHLLALLLVTELNQLQRTLRQLAELPQELLTAAREGMRAARDMAAKALREQLDELQAFVAEAMISVKRRMLRGFADAAAEYRTILVPISKAYLVKLARLHKILLEPPQPGETDAERRIRNDQALHAAALALAILDEFPRNMALFTKWACGDAARALASDAPVLLATLSILWMFPLPGQTVEVGGVELRSRLELVASGGDGAQLRLTVVVSEAGAGEPPPTPEDAFPIPPPRVITVEKQR